MSWLLTASIRHPMGVGTVDSTTFVVGLERNVSKIAMQIPKMMALSNINDHPRNPLIYAHFQHSLLNFPLS